MESDESKKKIALIIGITIGIIAILAAILIAFFAINSPKSNPEDNQAESLVADEYVVGNYQGYAIIDSEGNENTEEVQRYKDEYGIELSIVFNEDGTGTLSRKTESGNVTRNFTFKDGKLFVKEDEENEAAEGIYELSQDHKYVTVTDDAQSVVKFVRVE